jgi:transcriptional regulator with XRE-family HTH domain
MDQKKLGARIKEARLARQMTQSELVGEFITRNMLSQIESGSAAPSMKTLEYLSDKLDIPMSALVAEPAGELCQDVDLLTLAKNGLQARDYPGVLQLCAGFPQALWDEAQALSARAHFELAKARIKEKDFRAAIDCLEAAQTCSQNGIYLSNTINAQSTLLIEKCCQGLAANAGGYLDTSEI